MNPLSWKRDIAIDYHYKEGKAWIASSRRGKRCTALSYAAFEFRLAIERIEFQYWYTINNNEINIENFNDVRSFTRMQQKIYDIGGHQQEINKHFEFMQIVLDSLKINVNLITPNLGQLHKYWQNCSELCHVPWTITPKTIDLRKKILNELEEISDCLSKYISGLMSWPNIVDDDFKKIQNQYIIGTLNRDVVHKHLKRMGLYAIHSSNDERKNEFIGTAIKPNNKEI